MYCCFLCFRRFVSRCIRCLAARPPPIPYRPPESCTACSTSLAGAVNSSTSWIATERPEKNNQTARKSLGYGCFSGTTVCGEKLMLVSMLRSPSSGKGRLAYQSPDSSAHIGVEGVDVLDVVAANGLQTHTTTNLFVGEAHHVRVALRGGFFSFDIVSEQSETSPRMLPPLRIAGAFSKLKVVTHLVGFSNAARCRCRRHLGTVAGVTAVARGISWNPYCRVQFDRRRYNTKCTLHR